MRRLIAVTCSFGARCLHVLVITFGGFLSVPGRSGSPARAPIRTIIAAGPIGAGRSHIVLAAFGWLPGVLLLLAHTLASIVVLLLSFKALSIGRRKGGKQAAPIGHRPISGTVRGPLELGETVACVGPSGTRLYLRTLQ